MRDPDADIDADIDADTPADGADGVDPTPAAAPGPIRIAATINLFAAVVLTVKVLAQVALGIIAGDQLSISQGDLLLRSNDPAVWLARIAVMVCAGGGAWACWRARVAARLGGEQAVARACLLGACGGMLALLPALGILFTHFFTDEIDAPLGSMALRFLTSEPFFAPPVLGAGPNTFISATMGRDLRVIELLWLWPFGIVIANGAARALSPQLTGQLEWRDRRRTMLWVGVVALLGTALPFVPTGSSEMTSEKVARRFARALLNGESPSTARFSWPNCPPALQQWSPTDWSQFTGDQASPVAKIRIAQKMLTGTGNAANLAKYQFVCDEGGGRSTVTWVVVQVEATLKNGTVRKATLALSKFTGEWRVTPPRK